MTTHLFYHDPATPERCALQSWLALWAAFLPSDTVLVLKESDALPSLRARAPLLNVTGNADGTPFNGFAQAVNRGMALAQDDWVCVWRSDTLYPWAYHAALQAAKTDANLILPYETYHGLHYCDAAWCEANREAILRADEDELRTHAVVAPSYQTRAFPHFAVRANLWRRVGGFDARLHSERAAMSEWIARACTMDGCTASCPFEMIAFRQNTHYKIESRLTPQQMQQAESELQCVLAAPDARALLHDVLPPLRPRHPAACYSPFPRPARPVAVARGVDAGALMLQYARDCLDALALAEAADYAVFLSQIGYERAEAFHVLGTALYAQGSRFEAVGAFRKSARMNNRREYIWDLLTVWRDLHSLDDGLDLAQEWLRLWPDDGEVQEMADWFAARLAEWKDSSPLLRFFRPGALVFDVGAHYAVKAQEMLRQGAGALVCFDCQPNCVAALRDKYRDAANVVVMPVGLADSPGEIRFSICSAGEGISTFSSEWKTGRFADMNWNQTIVAPVTTLDLMIAQAGRPAYCKIDVEGFEYNVLRGLTQPLPCVSFEFAKEFLGQTRQCVEYLVTLGFDGFNVMIGDDERLLFGQAANAERLLNALEQSPDQLLWGDIYAFCSDAVADAPDPERLDALRRLSSSLTVGETGAAALQAA